MRCGTLSVCLVLAASLASASSRPQRPQLSLRASPRVGISPSGIVFVAELRGGDDSEEFHCPAVEWDWDDGSRSAAEGDCAPFETGAEIDRFFSARHLYRGPGNYTARLTLRRAGRSLAAATITVTIRGIGSEPE
jgi:hypothetical protein